MAHTKIDKIEKSNVGHHNLNFAYLIDKTSLALARHLIDRILLRTYVSPTIIGGIIWGKMQGTNPNSLIQLLEKKKWNVNASLQ